MGERKGDNQMSAVEDEDSLSDVNKPREPEMESEKLEIEGTGSEEKCESIPELVRSSPGVGREGGDAVSLEDKAVASEGGDESVLEDQVVVGASEFVLESVAEEAVAKEGGSETIAALSENLPLELQAEEETQRVDDANGYAVVTDTGDARLFSESHVDAGGDGLLVESQLNLKAEQEFSQVVDDNAPLCSEPQMDGEDEEAFAPVPDNNADVVVNDVRDEQESSDLLMDARGDELQAAREGAQSLDHRLASGQHEIKTDEEFTPVFDSMAEVVVTGVGHEQMETIGDELRAAREGMKSMDYKSEEGVSDGYHIQEVGGLDTEFEKSLGAENNAETAVQEDEVDEKKVDVLANDSEVGTAEIPTGIPEEKLDPVITEDTPITEVKKNAEMITEVNACLVNASEQEQAHELSAGMKYIRSDIRYEYPEDKEATPGESLTSGAKRVADEDTSMELLRESKLGIPVDVQENLEDAAVRNKAASSYINTKTELGVELELTRNVVVEDEDTSMKLLDESKLDEPVDVQENLENAEVKNEAPAGNIKAETEAGVELELTRHIVAEEIQLMNAEVGTEMGIDMASDKIRDDDGTMETEETASDVDEPGQDIYDSPAALQDEEDEKMVAEEETGTQDTEMETETDVADSGSISRGKRKRGKFSKSPSKAMAKSSSRKTVGEDVCFICFDGGELVLCDRRGCPKAYHPSCVNRDEAFFKSKGRWNCGWHLCSICEKNARYMCYTCTFSLCKSCIKDAVILCVRGNKGFCETCMRTVMLIESNEQGNEDTQIDFDDSSSWEYLFKDYYIDLKAKLSLSSAEIAAAKNPWKGSDISGPGKQELHEALAHANDGGSGSDNSIENLERTRPKRRKARKQSKSLAKEDEVINAGVAAGDKVISSSDNSEWASKELLEFVSHMKNGDTSVLSQFDVQALLLEYIKRNKLRDPRRKSQIICDARLENLFGKPRVGHFEMLKLLESHFLRRDEQNDDVQGSVVDTENNLLDIDGNADPLNKGMKDRKRKSRKKSDNRGPQSNLDDYSAIDMHNIGLIYLRRKLMEDLLDDSETFHDKVVGTFVRIRISGSTQKQDLYRLVQVVGTSKAAEPYKIGKKITDTMVEILNLDKTEIISIDTISNQEFTEEECKRLRQSIKCGLISRLTVGEILDKTMELQAARVNDWLESEILRLSHLRDRASDLGRRKELRECVEKLQLLKTPEERRRRLEEIPEIHADPKMDPSYESDDNDCETEDSRRDAFMRPRVSGFSGRGRGPVSLGSDNFVKDSWSGTGKASSKALEASRNLSSNNFSISAGHNGEIVNENSWNLERERRMQETNNSKKLNPASNTEPAEWALSTVARPESFSGVTSVSSQASLSAGSGETAVKINESEKMWHYQDPSGKVQGPFSMVQLRKWNNTGYFPADLKIWRTTEKQENSVLLADALAGKFPKELPAVDNSFPAKNTLHGSHTLVGSSGVSLHQDKEKPPNTDQNSGSLSKLSAEKWIGNDITSLPSPTPKQNNTGWTGVEGGILTGAIQSPGVNGVLPSPTPVLPNVATQSPAPASVLNSVLQTAAFSPTPNSQQGSLVGSVVALHNQSTTVSEPHSVQMHGHPHTAVQPVQSVISQNLQADTQGWVNGAQSGPPQGYGWGASNIQNSSGSFANSGAPAGLQPDVWRPTQGSQPNIRPPTATPDASWGMGPAENNTSMGVRPENPNIGWGPMPANPNMGWGNPAAGNTNMNWGPAMQVPPPGNPTGWVAPAGNGGPNVQGLVPGNPNSGWAPTQNWGAPPVQGPVPGNGWGPPTGSAGGPPPAPQGPSQGNKNQGWVAPPGNQGSWGGEQNHMGGQFPGPRGPQGRDSGFSGGRPWNRQSSFGGGGSRHFSKRDTICPYNANGRCKKGARCDYLHT